MTTATVSSKDKSFAFKDPDTGKTLPIGKVLPKESDSPKRVGAHETPATQENLNKLLGKFAK